MSVLLLLALALAQDPSPAEKKGLESAANAVAEFGQWCVKQGLADEAKAAAKLAVDIAPEAQRAKALGKAAEAVEAKDPDEKLRKELAKKRVAAMAKAAEAFDRLHALKPRDDKSGRFDAYLSRALELEPSDAKRWSTVLGVVTAAIRSKKWDDAERIVGRALALPVPDKLRPELEEKEDQVLQQRPMRKRASAHPMEYWISLPKSFSRGKSWPILVAVDGAACDWRGSHDAFAGRRGDLPFLLVTPLTTSNTNRLEPAKYPYPAALLEEADKDRAKFDEEGLLALLDDVRTRFHGREKIYITGFSGGGMLTYFMILKHPDMLAGAAAACGNFARPSEPDHDISAALGVPIAMFTGEKDEYRDSMIEPQTDAAQKILKERGYTNVKRIMLSGVGHSACADKVVEFFKETLP